MRRKRTLLKEKVVKFVYKTDDGWTCYNTGWVWPIWWKKDFTRAEYNKRWKLGQPPLEYTVYLHNRLVLKPNKEYVLIIDYPLSVPFEKKIKTGAKGMDLLDLIDLCVKSYKKIYEEERKTSTLKEESISKRTKGKSSLINRAQTNGKYGIWGHDLDDLTITHIGVKGKEIRLSVDS